MPGAVRSWRCKELQITLPIGAVRVMFERARKWSLAEGGRFDPRSETIFLWSAAPQVRGARPLGSMTVQWSSPTDDQATIDLIAWDRDVDGAVDQLCRGIELLAGALVRR
jgi:hypothetical protein